MANIQAHTNESNITLLFDTFYSFIENIKNESEWKVENDNTLSGTGIDKYWELISKTIRDDSYESYFSSIRMSFFAENIPFEPQSNQFKALGEDKLIYWNSFIFLIRRTIDKYKLKGLTNKDNTHQFRYTEVSTPFISKQAYVCRGHNKIDGIDETLGFRYTI